MSEPETQFVATRFEVYCDPNPLARMGTEVIVQCTDMRGEEAEWRWAVKNREMCLASSGEWEWEPLPSSRDDAFLKRCRFSFSEAKELAIAHVEASMRRRSGL